MDHLINQPTHLRTPSVGAIIKKMIEINPELGVQEMIAMMRKATRVRSVPAGDFSSLEVVDEKIALDLARGTLR